MLKDLSSLKETSCICQFLSHLSHFKQQWQFSLPSVHTALLERVIVLTSSCAALLSNRSNLKQVIKTMNASGVLPQEYGPAAVLSAGGGALMGGALGRQGSGRVRTLSASGSKLELDDSWVTASPAFMELQDKSVAKMFFIGMCQNRSLVSRLLYTMIILINIIMLNNFDLRTIFW